MPRGNAEVIIPLAMLGIAGALLAVGKSKPGGGHVLDVRSSIFGVQRDSWPPHSNKQPVARDWIVLHNTATPIGVAKYQKDEWIKRLIDSGMSEDKAAQDAEFAAKLGRLWGMPYHYVITSEGKAVYVNDVGTWTYHAGPANRGAIGIAIEGRFPYRESNRGPDHSSLTQSMVTASMAAISNAIREASSKGYEVKQIVAHSQTSGNRSDPGEAIWRNIARPAAKRFGIAVDEDGAWYDGKPLPGVYRGEPGVAIA